VGIAAHRAKATDCALPKAPSALQNDRVLSRNMRLLRRTVRHKSRHKRNFGEIEQLVSGWCPREDSNLHDLAITRP
jgi:hypothetical protein